MWPDGYLQAIRHEKLKGVDVRYMWPKEGRLAWTCGFVLHAATEQPGRSTLAVAAANTPKAAASLTDIFAYGSAQQEGVLDLIKDKELISIFSLDDPSAFDRRGVVRAAAAEPAGVLGGRRGGEGRVALAGPEEEDEWRNERP